MKILVVCQYYYPEPVRLTDICEELVKMGHSVTVLAGVPNYPMGDVYPGYKAGKSKCEVINGVEVIRCKTVPRKTDMFHRILNYFSYPLFSSIYVKKLPDDYDVVFTNQQSPVMMCRAAIRYKKMHNKKIVMYCMDLWPASLNASAIPLKSVINRLFHWISRRVYRQMDTVFITSESFKDYLIKEFCIDSKKIKYLPQYAECVFDDVGCVEDNCIDLMFAGNLGTAQSLDTVIEAAKILKDERIKWHIVGDGVELEKLKSMAEGMENVVFYGRKPLEDMPEYYKKADAMLVTLIKDPIISLTLPGKVQSYMSAGKPIIAAADGEIAEVIKMADCGYCGEAENAEELARNAMRFAESSRKKQMGLNAKTFCNEHFEKRKFMDILEEDLKSKANFK